MDSRKRRVFLRYVVHDVVFIFMKKHRTTRRAFTARTPVGLGPVNVWNWLVIAIALLSELEVVVVVVEVIMIVAVVVVVVVVIVVVVIVVVIAPSMLHQCSMHPHCQRLTAVLEEITADVSMAARLQISNQSLGREAMR